MPPHHNAWVWMDLEMTGLDPEKDRIIEMATIITDGDLRVIAEGPVIVIHQSNELLDGMDEWNTRTHNKTGLVTKVKTSRVTERQAEIETLDFIQRHTLKNRAPLCGNSICQDRRFLYKYMPELSNWLHYRNIDVSSFKEVARQWSPSILGGFDKRATHQALDDIKESIEELRYYRDNLIKLDMGAEDFDY